MFLIKLVTKSWHIAECETGVDLQASIRISIEMHASLTDFDDWHTVN